MTDQSRRKFLRVAGLTSVVGSIPFKNVFGRQITGTTKGSTIPFELGMASYTFRAFSLDQALEMTKRLGLKRITLKDMHLPMNSSSSGIAEVLKKIKSGGMELSACGVIYMTTEAEVNRAFDYAKLAGLKMFVGVPDATLIDLAEKKVKETNIELAIHNHGPTDKRFPSPESAYNLIAGRDKRLGLCIDVGHTRRLGLDPAKEAERFFDRLLDIHIKDVSSADAKGTTVEIGRGVIDTPELIKTLVRLKYSRTIHFEHEKDEKDPLPGVAESVGYVRGVLSTL